MYHKTQQLAKCTLITFLLCFGPQGHRTFYYSCHNSMLIMTVHHMGRKYCCIRGKKAVKDV